MKPFKDLIIKTSQGLSKTLKDYEIMKMNEFIQGQTNKQKNWILYYRMGEVNSRKKGILAKNPFWINLHLNVKYATLCNNMLGSIE